MVEEALKSRLVFLGVVDARFNLPLQQIYPELPLNESSADSLMIPQTVESRNPLEITRYLIVAGKKKPREITNRESRNPLELLGLQGKTKPREITPGVQMLVHHQGLSDLLRSSPVCGSPFSRLDPSAARTSTGRSRLTPMPFRVLAPDQYAGITKRRSVGSSLCYWYTIRGSNPGHPD